MINYKTTTNLMIESQSQKKTIKRYCSYHHITKETYQRRSLDNIEKPITHKLNSSTTNLQNTKPNKRVWKFKL